MDGPPSEGVGDVLAELRVLLDACGVLRDSVAACERVTGPLGSVWVGECGAERGYVGTDISGGMRLDEVEACCRDRVGDAGADMVS